MSFGKGSPAKTYPEGTEFYYIDIRTKGLPEPVFRIQTRNEKKEYVVVEEAARYLQGNITGISNKETKNPKANNALIRSVSLVMEANVNGVHRVYFVNVPHSYLGWNIMNAVAALTSFNDVSIELYQSKPRPGQDKTFASVSIKQAGQIVRGKFTNEELPPVPKVQVGDDTLSDKKARTTFFIEKVNEIAKVIRSGGVPATVNAAANAGSDEDVPF